MTSVAVSARVRGIATATFLFAAALHVVLAGHRPALAPEDLAPAARLARAASPLASAIDSLTTPPGIAPIDVHVLPLGILAVAAAVAAVWLRRLGLPAALAVVIGASVTLLPHTWTRHGAGVDPLLVLAALVAVMYATRGGAGAAMTAGTAAAVGIVHAPSMLWLAVPTLVVVCRDSPPRTRMAITTMTLLATGIGTAFAMWPLLHATCGVPAGGWMEALQAVWAPTMSEDTWSAAGLGTLVRAVRAEWHPFVLLVAAFGAWTHGRAWASFGRLSLATLAVGVVAAAAGAVDVAVVVPWLDAALLPWFGLGCWEVTRIRGREDKRTRGVEEIVVRGGLLVVVIALPVLQHSDRWAGALSNDLPLVRAAALARVAQAPVVVDSTQTARIARRHGAALVPGTATSVAACVAAGHQPFALGDPQFETTDRVHRTTAGRPTAVVAEPVPFTIALADLAHDVRRGADEAVALHPDASHWLRPRDAGGLEAFGLPADVAQRGETVAAVGTMPLTEVVRARPPQAARHAAEDERWQPFEAEARLDEVVVTQGAPPRRLATGELGVLVILDAAERPALVGLGVAEPGLPLRVHGEAPALQLSRLAIWTPPDAWDAGAPLLLPRRRPRPVDRWSALVVDVRAGSGWHDAEPAGDGSFRWSAVAHADATFVLARPQRLRLRVDATSAAGTDTANALTLSLNGELVTSPLEGARDVEIAPDMTRAGLNVLTFATQAVRPPGTVAGDPRALAAVVRDLRVSRWP